MRKFSPTPRQIFEATSIVTTIPKNMLRNSKNNHDVIVRGREMAFLLARLWTPCEPEQIPLLMGMKNVDEKMVLNGISEAAKALFFDLEEVREAIMHREAEPFVYQHRSIMDTRMALDICAHFNETPGSGYLIRKHGPLAEAQSLVRRGFLKVEKTPYDGVHISVAEGAIMQLNNEHPFM